MSPTADRRAAIIGAGLMGRWHADAVRRIGGSVAVIVDPNESARRALGARHPGAALMAELDATLVVREAAVAHVCTPASTHASLMTSLIAAGIHVLVEKPFTEDGASTRAIVALAEQRSVLACPVHQFVYQDGIRKLGEWIPQLGTIRRFEFSTCSAGAVHDPEHADELIAEILPHPLSLIAALFRARVASVEWHVAHPAPGEFRALGSVGPTVVDVAISAHGRPTENVLRIVADGGTVTADLFHGFAVRYPPTVSREAKMARPFAHSARHLATAAANLTQRALRGEVAYPGLRELVRAFYAAANRSGVPPSSVDAICDVADARDSLISRMTSRRG